MKNIILLAVLCSVFAACRKEDTNCNKRLLTGQWKWFRSAGGIGGVNLTPQNTGHSWALMFNIDSTCNQAGDLLPGGSGIYAISEEIDSVSANQVLKVSFPTHFEKYNYLLLAPDTLKLDDHIEADGLSHYLVRVEE